MYFDRHSIRRGTRSSTSSLCRCSMPPLRYLLITLLIFVVLLYLSAMMGKTWCDHEKSIINTQSNRQLELELTKLRQCIEEKAKMQQDSNDLQWEVEKHKRKNSELQERNEKLNDQVIHYQSKYESALQEIQKLKVEIEQLNEKHANIQQAIHHHIGAEGPQIIAKQPLVTQQKQAQKEDERIMVELQNDSSPFARNAVSLKSAKIGIAVVIFCYNRHSYLERSLESIFSILPPSGFSVFISQQGYDSGVTEVIRKYSEEDGKAYWLGFDYEATDKRILRGFEEERWKVYHKIAAHYKFAFEYLFDKLNYEKVIALEDDMEISPDFFSYFESVGKLMDDDASIFCVSAWNDYGQRPLVYDTKALYRTDIFPGLGWMMNQNLWNEFKSKWPLAFWDDWMREMKQRKNRSCIRPEINRVYTFGSSGSSEGQFFNQYLRTIELNKEDIDWTKEVEQLQNVSPNVNYDTYLKALIENSRDITIAEVLQLQITPMPLDYVVKYSDLDDYTEQSKSLNLMEDHKDGLPRQSYRGIVLVRWKNHRIIFVPQDVDWTERTVG